MDWNEEVQRGKNRRRENLKSRNPHARELQKNSTNRKYKTPRIRGCVSERKILKMKNLSLAFLVISGLMLSGTSGIAKGDNDDPQFKDTGTAFSNIVQLMHKPYGTEDGFCTGFFIGNGRFVSAGHCVNDETREYALTSTNESGANRQYKIDFPISSYPKDFNSQDFSVIFVDPKVTDDLEPLELDCEYTPKIGDALTLEGFPEDLGRMVTVGQVAAAKATPWALWSKPVFRAQLPASYGNSGSPVRLTKTGKVIGIAVGLLPNNRDLMAVQPISAVCGVLGIK